MDAVKHLLEQRLSRVKQELQSNEAELLRWVENVEGCKASIVHLKSERDEIERHLEGMKEAA